MRCFITVLVAGLFLSVHSVAWGSHPLITDDAGTQGKGKFQVEVNGQYDSDRESVGGTPVESIGGDATTILSYGFTENADVVIGLPYQWAQVKEDGVTAYDERGISDTTLEVKWRFFEKEGFSLALKPGLRIPTGNDERGLGSGRTGYQAFMIGSWETAPWEFHANIGYIGNENKADEEKNLWHASLAVEYEAMDRLEIVGNIGIEKNRDRAASQDPAFVLGGVVYEISESFSVDVGVKYGLNAAETDWSLLAGMAFRF
jgi:hypothetical protein